MPAAFARFFWPAFLNIGSRRRLSRGKSAIERTSTPRLAGMIGPPACARRSRSRSCSATSSGCRKRGVEKMIAASSSACALAHHVGVDASGHIELTFGIGMPACWRSPWSEIEKAEHRVLAGGIDRQAGRRDDGRDGGDVDDVAVEPCRCITSMAARELDIRPSVLTSTWQPDLVVGVLPGGGAAQDAGVVDPDGKRAALGGGRRHLAGGDSWLADVLAASCQRVLAQQLGGLAGGVLVHVRDQHRVARVPAQQARDLAADAAPRAGDHRRVHGAETNVRRPPATHRGVG